MSKKVLLRTENVSVVRVRKKGSGGLPFAMVCVLIF